VGTNQILYNVKHLTGYTGSKIADSQHIKKDYHIVGCDPV